MTNLLSSLSFSTAGFIAAEASTLGFYPGTTEYQIGSPLFDKTTIHLSNESSFVQHAKTNGPQRPYIRSATLNGAEFNKIFLDHSQIAGGGELTFGMTSAPLTQWAAGPESRPESAMEKVTCNGDAKPQE